jgi:RHS repeat-associated protein
VQENYTYDAGDHLLAAGSKSYTYDLNGNCTSVTVEGLTTTRSYDYENRVTQITYPGGGTNTFQYNGLGLRTRKVDSAGTFSYVCDGAEVASPVLSDGAAVYTPGLSERRAGVSKFYHADALGSTRGITHIGQSATDSLLYDGFGMTVSRTGSTPTPFGFVGAAQYQSDLDSGLMLLGHRYYDASVGRFLSKDPARQGHNGYIYCGNNPLTRTDPKGLWIETLLDVAGLVYDVYEFIQAPSLGNGLAIAGDVAGILLPGIPGVGAVRGGAKLGGWLIDEAVDVGRFVDHTHLSAPGGEFVQIYRVPNWFELESLMKTGTIERPYPWDIVSVTPDLAYAGNYGSNIFTTLVPKDQYDGFINQFGSWYDDFTFPENPGTVLDVSYKLKDTFPGFFNGWRPL